MVFQDPVSDWERANYYNGICVSDPPPLLYRTDHAETPFPFPKPKGRVQSLPTKSAHGIAGTTLSLVWPTVAPEIREILKTRLIAGAAILAARFETKIEDEEDGESARFGPLVVWIVIRPGITVEDAYLASPDILALLERHGVQGAVVEWAEGVECRFIGPPSLLPHVDVTDPTYHVRRHLTPTLGMPIAREDGTHQGSVACFFHEGKDKQGNASDKVFGVTNCHVLRRREDMFDSYEYKGGDEPPQHVVLAGIERFNRGNKEIEKAIKILTQRQNDLAKQLKRSEENATSDDAETAAKAEKDMVIERERLLKLKEDIAALNLFRNDINTQFGDVASRNIGCLHWAPAISIDEEFQYTLDLATFEVADRVRSQLEINVVDLGEKYINGGLIGVLDPDVDCDKRRIRLKECVPRAELLNPDKYGRPSKLVMKSGCTSDLTVGRLAGIEAYTAEDLGQKSIELVVFNHEGQLGDFCSAGDSGSLVFDGMGRKVGLFHTGLASPLKKELFVAYATPAWLYEERIKAKYPFADFNQ